MPSSYPEISKPVIAADTVVVRESLAIRILWRLPGIVLIATFVGAWFLSAGQWGGHALDSGPAGTLLLVLGGTVALIVIIDFIRTLRLAASKMLIIDRDGVGVAYGKHHRRLFPWAVNGIRVEHLMVGARIRLGHDTPSIIVSSADVDRIVRALDRLGMAGRPGASLPRRDQSGLIPGETIIWEGRPGLATLIWSNGWVVALAVPLPVLFVRWMWWIWTEPGWPSSSRFFWSLFALMSVGNVTLGIVVTMVTEFDQWFRELAGTIAVTNRRILWRAPRSGDVYREIPGSDVLSGALVDSNGRHGWIGLSYRDEEGEVREIDLKGLPHPDNAITAIESLMQNSHEAEADR